MSLNLLSLKISYIISIRFDTVGMVVKILVQTNIVTAILVSGGGDHDLESATKACSNPYRD